jgi:GNAT superfamily N-acetyltransferase
LNSELPSASVCYGLYDNNNIIGFCAVLHQPHGKIKNLKRCSRIVILPDYQGIGLGTKFLNEIAKQYHKLNYEFSIVTSAKNMIHALKKSDKWVMIRYSANKCSSKKSAIDYKRKSMRSNCKTASFIYKG